MILPISFLTLFTRATRANVAPFESITFSPLYSKGTNSSIVIKSKSSNYRISAYIENDLYTSIPFMQTKINGTGTYSFTYNNTYTRLSNRIYVVMSKDDNTTYSQTIDMKMVSPGYEDVNAHSQFTSNNDLVILDSNFNWQRLKVNYTFENFDDYYVPDYFHKFELSNFAVSIPEEQRSFFGCDTKLGIQYKNNVFDDIAGASNGYVEFKLKRRLTNGKYYFGLEQNLYVHPITLKVSSQKKDGYVQTRHIYFPRNDMHNQEDYSCFFLFENFGIDKDSVYHRFHIKALKNIIGDCHNSKYCVQKLYK